MDKDLQDFKEYAIDHLKHFEGIPMEFESDTGKIYDAVECWNMALRLGIVSKQLEEIKTS